ncbi:hypothetical protein NL676_008606 [Syzygium grande]|nr:hypothetical protein NL676_008606 [Syzygium grande]
MLEGLAKDSPITVVYSVTVQQSAVTMWLGDAGGVFRSVTGERQIRALVLVENVWNSLDRALRWARAIVDAAARTVTSRSEGTDVVQQGLGQAGVSQLGQTGREGQCMAVLGNQRRAGVAR